MKNGKRGNDRWYRVIVDRPVKKMKEQPPIGVIDDRTYEKSEGTVANRDYWRPFKLLLLKVKGGS